MLLPDLDRYYTPPVVARAVIEQADVCEAERCLDTACGEGDLLRAAEEIFPSVQCAGIDVDRSTVARLRVRHPAWTVSTADALSSVAWTRTRAALDSRGCALCVLNPPFSMATKKGVWITLPEFSGRCSVAMAHVLTALVRAQPIICCAILPESLLYSDMDRRARDHIRIEYDIRDGVGLRNSTFRGTRANSVIVRMERRQRPRADGTSGSVGKRVELAGARLVRGGLPLTEARGRRDGLPLVHSTNIRDLVAGGGDTRLRRVRSISRGIVRGHVILFPRVGVPAAGTVHTVHLRGRVQLSDCVLALECRTRRDADAWRGVILQEWSKLVSLYHGTGARYVTVARFAQWLATLNGDVARLRM